MLNKGITAILVNTQAIIVACAVIHNICIDIHDDLPNDTFQHEAMIMWILQKTTIKMKML